MFRLLSHFCLFFLSFPFSFFFHVHLCLLFSFSFFLFSFSFFYAPFIISSFLSPSNRVGAQHEVLLRPGVLRWLSPRSSSPFCARPIIISFSLRVIKIAIAVYRPASTLTELSCGGKLSSWNPSRRGHSAKNKHNITSAESKQSTFSAPFYGTSPTGDARALHFRVWECDPTGCVIPHEPLLSTYNIFAL